MNFNELPQVTPHPLTHRPLFHIFASVTPAIPARQPLPIKPKNILITGSPGVGKTTFIRKAIDQLEVEADGFYTQEMREGRRRVGFELCTLTGEKGILAHVDIDSPFRVGKYGVDLRSLEELAVVSIRRAIESHRLVIIDEIGRMELYSTTFRQSVLDALDSSAPLLATTGPQPLPFLEAIKSRADVRTIELTLRNRSVLSANILSVLFPASSRDRTDTGY